MSAPKIQEIRAVLDRARAMEGQEDTQDFAVEAPRVIARLVQILDLYVGHEPTVAEEAAYVRQQHRAEVLREGAEALRVENRRILWATKPATCAEAEFLDRMAEAGTDTREGGPASQPPLKGLVRQIRATANAEFATGHGRAVRDFARELETWIPEDYEPGGEGQ